MTRLLLSQTDFSTGELSPLVRGRSESDKYKSAVKTATNCYVAVQGPIVRRSGSRYIAKTKTDGNAVRLIRFKFSQSDAFVLEFGDQYIRFYTLSAQVQSGGAPYEISSPYTLSDIDKISYKQFGNSIYLSHGSYAPRVLTRVSTTDWRLTTLSLSPPPTYEAGETPSATVTPAATTGNSINFVASSAVFGDGDIGRQIINMSDGESGKAVITSLSGSAFSTTAVCDIVEDFTDTNAIASGDWKLDLSPISDITLDTISTGSIVTIDADLPNSTTASATFKSGDVGKYIIVANGVIKITQVVSSSQVKGHILKAPDSSDETAIWTLEEETWSASRGYPRAVGLVQERLCFGGTDEQPQTIWMSETGIFTGFGRGAEDSASIEITLTSSEVNQINWISSSRELIVGTAGAEVSISSGSSSGSITPSNISQRVPTYFGSDIQQPAEIAGDIIFIQQSGRSTLAFFFDFNIDTYNAEDLNKLSEHLTEGGIKELAYSQEPQSRIFAVTNSGNLLVATFERSSSVIGWCKYTTDGIYENVVAIPESGEDKVYVVVKRTVNGTDVRYLEVFSDEQGVLDTDGFSDSYLTYSSALPTPSYSKANPCVVTSTSHGLSNGDEVILKLITDEPEASRETGKTNFSSLNSCSFTVANVTTNTFELSGLDTSNYNDYNSSGELHKLVSTISGLSHLEGKTVQIKTDGASHPNKIVSSGSITLEQPAGEVVVGLPYTTTIKTLNKQYDIGAGPMQGQRSRWTRPVLRLYRSTTPTVGSETQPPRSGSDFMDKKVPLFTGDIEYGPQEFDSEGALTFTVSSPLPLILLGIYGVLEGGVK